jgi:hypothetical protein
MSEHNNQAPQAPTAVVPIDTQLILDGLPQLVGGIDFALRDIAKTKQQVGFVLVIVANGKAMFCTNGNSASAAACIKELAKVIDDAELGNPAAPAPTE